MTPHVVVAGLGSIGRRHLANARALEPAAHITVWRHRPSDAGEPPAGADRLVVGDDPAFDQPPTCAIVCGPASTHVAVARRLAGLGAHLLVEKPIAAAPDGVAELIEFCNAHRLTLAVGYNLRFLAPLRVLRDAVTSGRIGRVVSIRAEVGQYLPDWRPGRDYRAGVTASASLGGGALLELSHELDYVRWIAGEVTAVSARTATLGDLALDVEDTAEILLEFESGALGSVHLDLLQRTPSRSCKVVGTDGTLTWDGGTNAVRLFSAASPDWSELHPAAPLDRNEMYLDELRHFLSCVRGAATPAVTGDDGRRVLDIVQAARESSRTRRAMSL